MTEVDCFPGDRGGLFYWWQLGDCGNAMKGAGYKYIKAAVT